MTWRELRELTYRKLNQVGECVQNSSEGTVKRKRFRRRAESGGRGSAARRVYEVTLRRVLVIALTNFALGSQPVFGVMAWFKSAALGE